jgi:multidrug efflux system membrane fusion protein
MLNRIKEKLKKIITLTKEKTLFYYQKGKDYYRNSKLAKLRLKYRFVVILITLILLWILSGYIFFSTEKSDKQKEKLMTVEVISSTAENIASEIKVAGQTEAYFKVPIRAKTYGTVEKIIAKKGDQINKNDLILTLSLEDREAKLEAAKASIAGSKITYLANQELLKENLGSKSNVTQSEASYKSAKANLKSIKIDIDNTKVKAPFTGVLNNVLVDKGDFVTSGTPVAEILDLNTIIVSGSLAEIYRPNVKEGTIAEIKDTQDNIYQGLITYVSSSANAINRTFDFEIEVINENQALTDGMTVEITVPLGKKKAHKLSTMSMVTLNDEGEFGVKVLDQNDIVHFKKAKIVREEKDNVWISGLPNQTRIIIMGQEYVVTGEKAIPIERETTKELSNGKVTNNISIDTNISE